MAVVKTTRKSLLDNIMGSIMAVPIGILMFLASFVVLFQSEGCTNFAEVAENATIADAASASGHDDAFVSVTGTMSTDERIGDPDHLAPGPYLELTRNVQQYVWVQHSESESRDKVGGGTETVTTYTYELEWTSSPQDSSGFEDPSHQNPGQRVMGQSWSASTATVGAWGFDVGSAELPAGRALSPTQDMLLGAAARGTLQGEWVYLDGDPANPAIGDHRIQFQALSSGDTVTAFGLARGARLEPYAYEDDKTWLGIRYGSREEAIATFNTEHTIMLWFARIGGFLLMWLGMNMVFAPLQAVAGIIPFIKKGTSALVMAVTFPIALVLTLVTIIISKIFHSVVAMIIVGGLCAAGGFLLYKRYTEGKQGGGSGMAPPGGMPPTGPPAAGPPAGPPPGSPPGGPPAGPPPGAPPA